MPLDIISNFPLPPFSPESSPSGLSTSMKLLLSMSPKTSTASVLLIKWLVFSFPLIQPISSIYALGHFLNLRSKWKEAPRDLQIAPVAVFASIYLKTSQAAWITVGREELCPDQSPEDKGLPWCLSQLFHIQVEKKSLLAKSRSFPQAGRHWWGRLWSPQTHLSTFPGGFLKHGEQNFVGGVESPPQMGQLFHASWP